MGSGEVLCKPQTLIEKLLTSVFFYPNKCLLYPRKNHSKANEWVSNIIHYYLSWKNLSNIKYFCKQIGIRLKTEFYKYSIN